jgi:hypothetical protein
VQRAYLFVKPGGARLPRLDALNATPDGLGVRTTSSSCHCWSAVRAFPSPSRQTRIAMPSWSRSTWRRLVESPLEIEGLQLRSWL